MTSDYCEKCPPEDHESKFCRCESRNIAFAKRLRAEGRDWHSEKQKKKKDIFLTITHENMNHLFELYRFVTNWEYPKQERDVYRDDLGKIETENCTFRFVKHVNVTYESKPFFLSSPDEKDLQDMTEDFDFAEDILKKLGKE